MVSKFRKRMLGILVVCLCLVAFSMYYIDTKRMNNQLVSSKYAELGLIQDNIIQSLRSVDKAYSYFDKKIASDMRRNSTELLNKYTRNPDVSKWDLQKIKEKYGMDVYILDDKNIIRYSSFEKDIGLNFSACCSKFANKLSLRRVSGEFYHDGIDLQQKTGEVKKFSYVGTPDKKYLIELGYSLENDEIFDTFNFMESVNEIRTNYEMIDRIRVYNSDGYLIESKTGRTTRISNIHRKYFDFSLGGNREVEVEGTFKGRDVMYRYVPYKADVGADRGMSRVVEIVYNDNRLADIITDTQVTFVLQLLLVLLLAIVIANVSSLMVAHPMYLAFHDSLTGLRNRASYESIIKDKLMKRSKSFGILLLDLDNFKRVNDLLGHDKGDLLLQYVARCIERSIKSDDVAIRLGGDEFMILLPNTVTEEHLERVARRVMLSIVQCGLSEDASEEDLIGYGIVRDIKVSMSVGGVLYPNHGNDIDTLYKNVDVALYRSKDSGKDAYTFYK